VNTAIYDAVNALPAPINRTSSLTPRREAPERRRRRAGRVHGTLGSFPGQAGLLEEKLAESLASIPGDRGRSHSIARGRAWGEHVARTVLAWRATDGLSTVVPPYFGGFAPGQWRSIPMARSGRVATVCDAGAFHDEQFIPIPARPAACIGQSAVRSRRE